MWKHWTCLRFTLHRNMYNKSMCASNLFGSILEKFSICCDIDPSTQTAVPIYHTTQNRNPERRKKESQVEQIKVRVTVDFKSEMFDLRKSCLWDIQHLENADNRSKKTAMRIQESNFAVLSKNAWQVRKYIVMGGEFQKAFLEQLIYRIDQEIIWHNSFRAAGVYATFLRRRLSKSKGSS